MFEDFMAKVTTMCSGTGYVVFLLFRFIFFNSIFQNYSRVRSQINLLNILLKLTFKNCAAIQN
jgi:hypothetical protein